MESGGTSVIHRKARASREEYQARAMSPAKALRLALAQASDTLLGLPMVVAAVEQVEISQTALRAEFAQGGLMVLLDGPKGARGAVRLDEALLAALIEIQTTGRVTGRGTGAHVPRGGRGDRVHRRADPRAGSPSAAGARDAAFSPPRSVAAAQAGIHQPRDGTRERRHRHPAALHQRGDDVSRRDVCVRERRECLHAQCYRR